MTPFDFINSINYDKKDLFEDPQAEKDYASFIINRGLSYFPDTVFHANEMNKYNMIPKRWQFDYLMNSIQKKKRYSKWNKKEVTSDNIKIVMEYFKYSEEKAVEALSILNEEQLTAISSKLYKGGRG